MWDNGLERNRKLGVRIAVAGERRKQLDSLKDYVLGLKNEQGKVYGEDYMILDDKRTETLKELLNSSARCD